MQVTINDVRYAVIAALNDKFPNSMVTGEENEQNLTLPYYYVHLLEWEQEHEQGRRFMRRHPFDIRYYSDSGTNEDLYTIAEQLVSGLQQIVVAEFTVRGTHIRAQITDEVLHFFVNYDFMVYEMPPERVSMQMLQISEEIR